MTGEKMRLMKLALHNFKGLREFDLDPDGEDISVYGDNATGKTTLADGWFWLLFSKDSNNKSDFEIKTLGEDGQPIHGLDHEVEATLSIGERLLVLKKVYRELWTKKRGSADSQFTGHTTDHFLDGVPVKKNEYEATIAELVNEDVFKLLTNPRHFNEVLNWRDRRKILLEVCGDVSDEDVIGSNDDLAKLPEILNGHKLEDYRKIIQSKKTEINKELERVPVRIDEAERNLPEPGDDTSVALTTLKDQRNEQSKVLANLEAGGGVAEKTKELRVIEAEMLRIQREHWTESANKTQAAKVELRGLKDGASELESVIQKKQCVVADNQDVIVSSEKVMEELRYEWKEESAKTFTFEQSDTCPTCMQALPADQVKEAREKALADFNAGKAQQLEDISNKGKIAKNAKEANESALATASTQITEAETKLTEVKAKIVDAEALVESLEKQEKDYLQAPAYQEAIDRKSVIEADIAKLKEGHATGQQEIVESIHSLDEQIQGCEQTLAQIEQRALGLIRIKELKGQERQLAAEYEKLEQELFLTEQFVRAKVQLLEGKINSRFDRARFKLFDVQVNGAIAECCETTYQGVPYGSALNNSARINIGLDTINTLSAYYGFVAPIWLDNAEAVTQLLETKGQQIKLYVSEADKVLRIEKGKED